ncbi:MAG: type III pantothenate kinase [Burkholderiaceae bacterium]
MSGAAQLLIDAGNSRVKAALLHAGVLGEVASWPHAEIDALPAWLATQKQPIHHAWMVSVASEELNTAIQKALATRDIALTRWRGTPLPSGFHNAYAAPTLGPDRLLAALAARRAHAAQVLVVASFGTATTVDLVAGDTFRGGVIAPGVGLMSASLARNTAHLPLSEGRMVPVPDNTHDAIYTGICAAQRGAVMYMLDAAALLGTPQLVICGGNAAAIAPALPPHLLLPDAVLKGLAQVATAGAAPNA